MPSFGPRPFWLPSNLPKGDAKHPSLAWDGGLNPSCIPDGHGCARGALTRPRQAIFRTQGRRVIPHYSGDGGVGFRASPTPLLCPGLTRQSRQSDSSPVPSFPCHRASPGAEDAPVSSAVTTDKPGSLDGFVLALTAAAALPHTCNELGGLSLAPPSFPRGREWGRGGICQKDRGLELRAAQGSAQHCWEHPSLG